MASSQRRREFLNELILLNKKLFSLVGRGTGCSWLIILRQSIPAAVRPCEYTERVQPERTWDSSFIYELGNIKLGMKVLLVISKWNITYRYSLGYITSPLQWSHSSHFSFHSSESERNMRTPDERARRNYKTLLTQAIRPNPVARSLFSLAQQAKGRSTLHCLP
jgi:hypothetical protein